MMHMFNIFINLFREIKYYYYAQILWILKIIFENTWKEWNIMQSM